MHDLNMVQKNLIRLCMVSGKKTKSSTILIQIFKQLSRLGHDPIEFLNQAVDNVKPILEVKRRSGGREGSLRSPSLIPTRRQQQKALRWLIEAAEKRSVKKASETGRFNNLASLRSVDFVSRAPLPLTPRGALLLAPRELNLQASGMALSLLEELKNAYTKTGVARQKRDELHKQVEASR